MISDGDYSFLPKDPKVRIKNTLKQYLKIMLAIVLILTILSIFSTGRFFSEQAETLDLITSQIETEATRILEEIYNDQIVLKFGSSEIVEVLFGGPSRRHGTSQFTMEFLSSRDTIIIYWEIIDDFPEIRKIENQSTRKVIFESRSP